MEIKGTLEQIIPHERKGERAFQYILKEYPDKGWVSRVPFSVSRGNFLEIVTADEEIKNDLYFGCEKGGYIKSLKVYLSKQDAENHTNPFITFSS